MLTLLLASLATMAATGLGAVPVFFLGERAARLRAAMVGVAIGVMAAAAALGLLVPAVEEGGPASVAGGFLAGTTFLLIGRRWLTHRREVSFAGLTGAGAATSLLVFAVLFVHSLPEGLAMGSAYASGVAGLGAFVIVAIAIQNVPEGTAVAIPMAAAGSRPSRQLWAAVATSVPQPVGALLAYALVEEARAVLPFSLAFAAGAMLALIVVELIPEARGERRPGEALAGAFGGGAAMAALSLALGVG